MREKYLRSLRGIMAVSSVVVGRTADRQSQSSSDAHVVNPSRDSAFSEIVMANAVGLALGCVGLSLLMSLSSVPYWVWHMSSLADMLLVGCCLRMSHCSSMVHLRWVHHQCCSRSSIVHSITVAVRHCRRVVITTRSFVRSFVWCFVAFSTMLLLVQFVNVLSYSNYYRN